MNLVYFAAARHILITLLLDLNIEKTKCVQSHFLVDNHLFVNENYIQKIDADSYI